MKDALKLGVILFLITGISVGILGTVNQVTTPIIEKNTKQAELEAMQQLISEANEFPEVEAVTDELVKKVFLAKKGDETIGYVLRVEPKGYGGAIGLLVGIDANSIVKGVKVLEHSETPGFGANASDPSFIDQYIGKGGNLTVVKIAPGENEIQAITGATITSSAITSGINEAINYVGAHQAEWRDQ